MCVLNATGSDWSSHCKCCFIFDVECGYFFSFVSVYSASILLSYVFRLVKLLMDLMIAWDVLFLMEYNMIMVSILSVTLTLI